MHQALSENSNDEPQGYTALGLINTHADEAKRDEYPLLQVVRDSGTGVLYAHEPQTDLSTLGLELGDDSSLSPNSRWEHTNGSAYLCHGVAAVAGNARQAHPILVVYEDCSNGKLWGKSIKRFLQGMTKVSRVDGDINSGKLTPER